MVEAWFAIFWLMVAAYTILDGRNLGAAALRPFVAKDPAERRQVLDAIGPLWTWHEVWLIAAGGVLLLAFPAALAAAFAGFYLALFLVLWLLIGRGIAMEVGGHLDHALWQSFWTFILSTSSAGLALILGVAFGNIVRGVPMDASGEFQMALFTDFGVHGRVGLLDWYTVSVGALSLVVLLAHGGTFLTLKTAGPVRDRSRAAARKLWIAALALGVAVLLETRAVRQDLWSAPGSTLLTAAFLAITIAGAVAIFSGLRRGRERLTYIGSCTTIAGVLGVHAAASFPTMLHSTLAAEYSLSAFQAASPHKGAATALGWWVVAAPIAVLWAVLVGRAFGGRVGVDTPNRPQPSGE